MSKWGWTKGRELGRIDKYTNDLATDLNKFYSGKAPIKIREMYARFK